ncbi:hypothetical protein GCM10027589_58770 [Actinocorallia lasiicapitis]
MRARAALVLLPVALAAPVPAQAAEPRPTFKIVKRIADNPISLRMSGPKSGWLLSQGSRVHRWTGKAWRFTPLPAGARGIADVADGWAVGTTGSPLHEVGPLRRAEVSTIVRWDGRRWRIAARVPGEKLRRVAVLGPRNVWVFGDTTAWHFNGRAWKRTGRFASFELEKVRTGAGRIYGTTFFDGRFARWDGRRWRKITLPLPARTKKREVEVTSLDVHGKKIIVSATSTHLVKEFPEIETFVLRFDGRRWTTERPRIFQRMSLFHAFADGRGGLWAQGRVTSWARQPSEDSQCLFHRDAKGRWQRWKRPLSSPWIEDLTLLPGTHRLLAALTFPELDDHAGALAVS